MGWVAAVSLLLNENFVGRQAFDMSRAVEFAKQAFPDKPLGIYVQGNDASLAASFALASSKNLDFYILRNGFLSFRQFFDRPRSLAASFELKKDDRDRTTSFDREIPFADVPFDALRAFDIPDLLARSRARGLVVHPIDGDWDQMKDADARKLLNPQIGLITGPATDLGIRDFLDQALSRPLISRDASAQQR
jgi:hypothetical protein